MRSSFVSCVVLAAVLGVGLEAAAKPKSAPPPVHKLRVTAGFIDDVLAMSPDGSRLAYIHNKEQKASLVITQLGATAEVRVPLTGFPVPVRKLAFSPDSRYVLVVGVDPKTDRREARVVGIDGKSPKRKIRPATDFALGAVEGAAVVTALDVRQGRKGSTFSFTAYDLTDLKVRKRRSYKADVQGLLKGLDMRVVSYAGGFQRIVGQRKGEYDKKNDIRRPENIAELDAFSGKIVKTDAIKDPIGWAEVVALREKRLGVEAFLVIEGLKKLLLVDRQHRRRPVALAVPLHLYEPKSLRQQLIGNRLYFSLTIDPVNPEATSKGKTDKPDTDLYVLDVTTGRARSLFRLRTDRQLSWNVAGAKIAILRKYKNFSRGGEDVAVYPVAP